MIPKYKHIFKGGDELPPDVPSPTPEEWDAFITRLDEEGHMASYRRFMAREQERAEDLDGDEDGYDPEERLERSIQ